jgi:hypothetical protein
MNQFQQNEQVKLPKMIEEPSASTIKFKFQFTNELFDKFENAYAGNASLDLEDILTTIKYRYKIL